MKKKELERELRQTKLYLDNWKAEANDWRNSYNVVAEQRTSVQDENLILRNRLNKIKDIVNNTQYQQGNKPRSVIDQNMPSQLNGSGKLVAQKPLDYRFVGERS